MNDEPNLFEPIDELGQPRQKPVSALRDPFAEEPLTGRAGVFSLLETLLKRPGALRHALRHGAAAKPILTLALMATLHLALWAVSVGLGGRLLRRFLARPDAPARIALWLLVYGLVSLQMLTALRPIIGQAETLLPTEKRFFLEHFGRVLEEAGQR